MIKLFRPLVLLLPVLFLTFAGCKKEDDTTSPSTPITAQTVTFDKSTVTPGEVITLNSSAKLDSIQGKWEIKVGGATVQLIRTGTRQAAFIVPAAPVGLLALDLTSVGVQAPPTLTMATYTIITDPQAALTVFQAKLATAVTQMEQLAQSPTYPVSAQNVTVLKNLQQSLPSIYASATPAQQLEAAYIFQKITLAPVNFSTLGERTLNDDPADKLSKMSSAYINQRIWLAYFTGLVVAGVATANPLLTAVAAVGMLYNLNQSLKIQEEILDVAAMAVRINDYSNRPTDTNGGTLTLAKDVAKSIRIQATYRTLQAADAQGTNLLQQVFSTVAAMRTAHGQLQTALNYVKRFMLGSNGTLSPFVEAKTQAANAGKNMPARTLQIKNVSNPAIRVTSTAQGELLALTASSSTITTTTPFTFDVTYSNAVLGTSAHKTINAEFVPNDSTAFYTNAAIGTWKTDMYDTATGPITGIYYQTLNADGTGTIESVQIGGRVALEEWYIRNEGTAGYVLYMVSFRNTWVHWGRITHPQYSFRTQRPLSNSPTVLYSISTKQ